MDLRPPFSCAKWTGWWCIAYAGSRSAPAVREVDRMVSRWWTVWRVAVDVPVDDAVDNSGFPGDNRPLPVDCPVDLETRGKCCRKALVGQGERPLEISLSPGTGPARGATPGARRTAGDRGSQRVSDKGDEFRGVDRRAIVRSHVGAGRATSCLEQSRQGEARQSRAGGSRAIGARSAGQPLSVGAGPEQSGPADREERAPRRSWTRAIGTGGPRGAPAPRRSWTRAIGTGRPQRATRSTSA